MPVSGPTRRSFLTAAAMGLLCGCRDYADFELPRLPGPAVLPSFRWQVSPEPVMSPGPPGSWDSVDVLNPSVIRVKGVYWNLYSGFDGKTWHTGVATSPDGLVWTRHGRVLSPEGGWEGTYIAANGSVLHTGEEFLYWYQAGTPPAIGLARSRDGKHWLKHGRPVLAPGPRGSWDERGVADPYVIWLDGYYFMYFLGQDRARRQRLGLARSRDGLRWQKLRSNPVMQLGPRGAFDEVGLGEPAVWVWRQRYLMAYTGRDRNEFRRIGLAWSTDGVKWARLPDSTVFAGDQPWNSKVVCDPSVLVENGIIRVWFGGGNVAAPAENLNGQIGYATLETPDVNLTA